ncbi:MAG: AMP-binding protein [Acidimicrobiales bacterium]|nr:AMP-binding protein [Acidimicrobiales bacterium]
MGEPTNADPVHRWARRPIPEDVTQRWIADGWWRDESLGDMVAAGLERLGDTRFEVHSKFRPWSGTFGDVDRAARSMATELRARGVGAGDVIVVQLPNWVEAGITFWAAAYLGAVVVPIVHFYGAKEVDYILRSTQPAAVVSADRFGHVEHLAVHGEAMANTPVEHWFVVGETPAADLPAAAQPFATLLDAEPLGEHAAVNPDAPTIIGFTSGTTRDPKGVVHSHRTIACETRQLDYMYPQGGPSPITGAPVGHFIGMLNAFLTPLLREREVHLVDVWDPGEILRLMLAENIGVSGGATYFMTSLLDHPDFSDAHLALMPYAGLGGSTVPIAVMERMAAMGITAFRSYGSTEHPSITGSLASEPAEKRHTTDGHAMPGVEVRLTEEGEILSRGPDCCVGYTDAELTARVFDEDGWYHSGDVGVMDDDGYLAITDRLSDVIIRGGENISAQEVEEQLMGLDAVAEVAVVGRPDDRLGERAAAIVRLRDGQATPTLDEVRAHLEQVGLARQKWPESIVAVDEFPRTPSGKVQKYRLRAQLRDGSVEAQP